MSNVKKLIAGMTAAAIVAGQALSAVVYGATGLNDPEFTSALSWMYNNGLTKYSTEEGFRPYDTLTREQAAKFFVEFAKKVLGKTAADTTVDLTDLDKADASLKDAIVESVKMGLFKGSAGKFMPTDPMTKAASLTVLVRAMVGAQDENVQPWWKNYFEKARELGLTKETDAMALDKPITRYEIALLLYRASGEKTSSGDSDIGDLLNDLLGGGSSTSTGSTSTGSTTTPDEDTTTGDEDMSSGLTDKVLEVALDPDTSRNQYVPSTGSQIRVMKLDFLAGSSDVKLSAVTVKLQGLADRTKIQYVYMVDEDGRVLTSQRSFNTEFEARLVFNSAFVVPAGKVKKLYVAVDLINASGQIMNFSVNAAASIEADVTVQGDFPIQSFTTQATSYSATTYQFEAEQTSTTAGSKTESNADGKIYVGDTNKRIMRFALNSSTSNNRDMTLKSISFRGINRLENVIDNVKLIVGSENIAKEVIIDGKNLTVVTDYKIPYGTNKTFYINADIVGGEKTDNVQLYINKLTDITGIEADTNAAVRFEYSSSNYQYGSFYDLIEGDNLISKSSETPTSQNVPTDEKDIIGLVATVNVTNAMQIEKIRVYLSGTTSTGVNNLASTVDRVRLFIDDKFIDEVAPSSTDQTNGYVDFSFNDTLSSSKKFVVKFSTKRSAAIDSQVKNFTIDGTSFTAAGTAEYVSSRNTVLSTDIKGSAVNTSVFTVKTAGVSSITKNDGLAASENIVSGVQNYQAVKLTVQADNVRALTLNGFKVTYIGTGSSAASAYTYISNLRVKIDGNVVSTDNFGNTSSTLSSLGISVPKGGTKDIVILVDIGSGFPAGTGFQLKVDSWDFQDDRGYALDSQPSTTIYSSVFNVQAGGILYVDRDTNTPKERVLSANPNVEQEIARLKFKSTKDDSIIQELTLANIGTGDLYSTYATGVASSSTSTGVVTSADNLISSVLIYNTTGTLLGTATMVNGLVSFKSLNVDLPREQDVILIVKARANAINNTTLTNKPVNFALWKVGSSYVSGSNQTKIVSKSNGAEVSDVVYSNNVYGNAQIYRATNLTLSSVTQSNTTALAGTTDMYSMKLVPDAAKAAKVKEISLDVTVTDNPTDGTGFNMTNLKLYRNGSEITSSNVSFVAGLGACSSNPTAAAVTTLTGTASGQTYCVTAILTGSYINGFDMSAGSENTFLFRGDATASTKSDGITVRLNELATDKSALTYAGAAALATSLVWSDNAADNVTVSDADWYTDEYLSFDGITSWSISRP